MASELTRVFQDQNKAVPTPLGRLAYASADFGVAALHKNAQEWSANATSQAELLARQGGSARSSVGPPHQKERQKQKEASDRAAEAIEQAYTQFQETYTTAMAFYDDADHRLDRLEARIKDQIHDIESQTELLEGKNGEAIYQDERGGFYTVRNNQRVMITDEEELKSLREQVRDINASGQSVRTEAQQATLVELTVMLADAMDLRGDVRDNRHETNRLNQDVENDPSKAAEADPKVREMKEGTEQRLDELERKVDGLEAKGNQFDQQQNVDAPLTPEQEDTFAEFDASLDQGVIKADPIHRTPSPIG